MIDIWIRDKWHQCYDGLFVVWDLFSVFFHLLLPDIVIYFQTGLNSELNLSIFTVFMFGLDSV